MIFTKLKTIFIHIPKTAGQSVEKILGANVKKVHQSTWDYKHGYPNCQDYERFWDQYYKFTFVRNPYARLVSAYFYDLQMVNKEVDIGTAKLLHSRRRIIKRLGEAGFEEFVYDHLPRLVKKDLYYSPQSKWIKGYEYDRIGRVEKFDDEMKDLCFILGVEYKPTHTNRSKHKKFRKYYTSKKLRNKVRVLYKEDFDLLSYEW
jgi:chondroitin 4-sulfotransferase 11